ncbi:MAG: PRC-barrel domain-containing protein, partial [Bacillota bacterium]|nr:PRC-barrel domain-containing protein [Bacillota bacterium]
MTERLAESRTSKSIIGMPLYSIREGLALGLIRQVLLDGKNRCVQGFLVEKRRFSREDRILPFSAVSSFGQDGLMVERQSQLER